MRTDNAAGGTLADRLRSGPLARLELEQIAVDLLEMLASLHNAGKLHTDLNPETVRLDRAGRLHSSKVGAQRGSERAANGPSGSPHYLAPELAVGKPADAAADLFACGVLLQECAGPDASAPVLVLIGMLTSAEPDLRPASANEALALLRAQAPVPVQIPPTQTVPIPLGKEQPAAVAVAPAVPQVPPARPAPSYRQSFEKPKAKPAAETIEPVAFPPVLDFPPVEPPAVFSPADPAPVDLTAPDPVAAPVDYAPYPADLVAAYRSRRRRRIALTAAGVAVAIAAAVGIGLAASGGGGEPQSKIPAPASDAPLSAQLDGLDQAITGITKH